MPGLSPLQVCRGERVGREDEQRQSEADRSPQLLYKFTASAIRVPQGLKLIWQRKHLGTAKNMVKNNSERGLTL